MKKIFAALFVTMTLSCFFVASAYAGNCDDALKKAAEQAAKDKDCQKDAKNLFGNYIKQIKICRDFRKIMNACRKAKRNSTKHCNRSKRHTANHCRKNFRNQKRACLKKKGKSRRHCLKSARQGRAGCLKGARQARRACVKAARHVKRACRDQARATAAFQVCRSARRLTGKSAGNALKCAGKYFAPAALTCVGELFGNKGQ